MTTAPDYVGVWRFHTHEDAGRAYYECQEMLLRSDARKLSVFRVQPPFQIYQYVVIWGTTPPPELQTQLESTLQAGVKSLIPDDVLEELSNRYEQANQPGVLWIENHLR